MKQTSLFLFIMGPKQNIDYSDENDFLHFELWIPFSAAYRHQRFHHCILVRILATVNGVSRNLKGALTTASGTIWRWNTSRMILEIDAEYENAKLPKEKACFENAIAGK